MTPYRLVFMGTPDFAVPSLEALHQSPHRIVAVVTQPDRPKGRGRTLSPPPVKVRASALGLPVWQPSNLNAPELVAKLREAVPDWLIVIAYGRILRKNMLDLPRLGAINVHASLLPHYRGPAPIQWAVINGDPATGVTTMLMDEGLDHGEILLQAETPIATNETTAELHDRLARMGADLLLQTLARHMRGDLRPSVQDHDAATYAPLLSKDDGIVQWNSPAHAIDARIRGLTPWPGAFTFLDGRRLKIYKVRMAANPAGAAPGTVLTGFEDELRVAAADGALSILELQLESCRRMAARDFLKGNPVPTGTRLG